MAEQFYEISLEGPTGRTLGFVQGFLTARGEGGRILDAYREGFDCESLRERIRELFHPSKQTYHLLVPADLVPTVDEAVKEGKNRGMEIEVMERRLLSGARFSFSFETFSRDHGAMLRALFEAPPQGVTIDDLQIEETLDPEAKGVEAYAPAHEYQLEGKGTVHGALRAVLALHKRARGQELIKESKLEVVDA
jgi:hypothetical protein